MKNPKSNTNLAPSFSYRSSASNLTGSWRFIKPLYQNKMPPCNAGCPNSNNIQGFIAAINDNNLKQAFALLSETTPFPAVCGRVCYHPCESHCNRMHYDESINICGLERIVGDYALENNLSLAVAKTLKSNKKIAIVGSGPAGLTCAYHLKKLGHQVTVFESRAKAGGMLRHGIPEFRLPKKVLDGEIKRLTDLGIEIKLNYKINQVELEKLAKDYNAVLVAIGAYKPKDVPIKNNHLKGVSSGLNFLLSHAYETNQDQYQVHGKKVAVVGGGNTAIDTARTALRLGATPTIYYRRTKNEMPAHPDEVREAMEEGIKIEFLTNPVECQGQDKLTRVVFQRMRLGEKDSSGREKAVPLEGSNFEVDVDFLFTAFGEDAEMEDLANPLENKWGRFVRQAHFKSKLTNVFVAGDAVVDTKGTVVHAMGEGQRVARILQDFMEGKALSDEIVPSGLVSYQDLNVTYFKKGPRSRASERGHGERERDFLPVIHPLSKEAYTQEAHRCFSCGVCNYCRNCELFCPDKSIKFKAEGLKSLHIDYDHCKGCGICVYECPRCAMDMAKE